MREVKTMRGITKRFILLLILFSLSLVIIYQQTYAKAKVMAKVHMLKGKAQYKVKGSKSYQSLKRSQKLESGSTIKTLNKSTVSLKLFNGSLIELRQNSQIILNQELLKRSSVSLIKGGAKFKINKLLKAQKFNVYTPTAVAGVRGTEYDIGIANDGSMAVNVSEGAVAVNNGQSEAAVGKNQNAAVSLDDKKVKSSKGEINIDDRNQDIEKKIDSDPSKVMGSINGNLADTAGDQKKTVDNLSALKDGDNEKAGNLVDSALFNQCKSEGLYGAASRISEENKDDKEVQDAFKTTSAVYQRLSKLNKLLDEKFARIDRIYEEKGKSLDKKLNSIDEKLKGKFKDFNFD
jgi:hypothetical protein